MPYLAHILRISATFAYLGLFSIKAEILVNRFERLKKKAINGSKAVVRAAKHKYEGGEFSVSKEEFDDRVEVCKTCLFYEKYAKDECGDCLCFISWKASMASEYCPQFKWVGDEFKAPNPYED